MSKQQSSKASMPEPLSFEAALEKLEALIEEMEGGKTPLDKLIQRFEDGTKLVKVCQEHLNEAELKIEKLKDNLGELEFEPVDPDTE